MPPLTAAAAGAFALQFARILTPPCASLSCVGIGGAAFVALNSHVSGAHAAHTLCLASALLQTEPSLDVLRLAHSWALLVESGCSTGTPPPSLATYLGNVDMQRQAG